MYRVRKILSFFFFCQTMVWGTIRFSTGEPAGVGHAVLLQSDTYLASVKQVAGGIFWWGVSKNGLETTIVLPISFRLHRFMAFECSSKMIELIFRLIPLKKLDWLIETCFMSTVSFCTPEDNTELFLCFKGGMERVQ